MADASLYFRTPSTSVNETGYATVLQFLSNAPASQIITFTAPNDIFESWGKEFTNNITQQPIPNNIGNRALNTIDNGLSACIITITGRFKNPTADADAKKLEQFASQAQNDVYNQFGNIGLYSPNAARYNLDPTSTQGYMVKSFNFRRLSNAPNTIEFTLTLAFGGAYVPQ